jgi:glycosyltransferase involved in cell wall biosynthesis
MHIILKAIINSKIKIIHVVNSEIALQLIKYYSEIFKEYNIKTIVSLFCPDYDWINNKFSGFPVLYPEVMCNADIVLSDNQYWYKYFKELAGQDFNYKKLFSPIDEILKIKQKFSNNKKILWASRICNQKLMGVLYGVCKKRQDITFVIYGNRDGDKIANTFFNKLLKLKNVEYRDSFSSISDIDVEEFDLFLYTSLFDGIPNIILEMISLNIPIIASNIGGISEVFKNDYELLVEDVENDYEYCLKIKNFYSNPEHFFNKMNSLRENILKENSQISFQKNYLDIIRELDSSV